MSTAGALAMPVPQPIPPIKDYNMNCTQSDLTKIVELVVQQLGPLLQEKGLATAACCKPAACGEDGIFDELEDAIAAAEAAHKQLNSIALRDKAIAAIRSEAKLKARELAEEAVRETGMGRVEDKIKKKILQAERTPGVEALYPAAVSGDAGLALTENAPWGLIASVIPCTNPAATVINNAISMIAGGNAVIFAPHPRSKQVSIRCIQMLNRAIYHATGIQNLLTALRKPSLEAAQRIFTHPRVSLLVVTGGEAVVEAARKIATMRIICAGAGNPPVLVDETADIARAARSIYDGASFDNNIICADEKVIIVVDKVADAFNAAIKDLGAVFVSLEQADAIAKVVFKNYPGQNAVANPEWVGKDASKIAAAAGISVPESCRLLLVDVGRDCAHAFVHVEQMMPVLPVLHCADAAEGIEWAVKAERGLKHTAGLHSRNIDVMDAMARRINNSLFVKNGPHIAGLGAGGEGWTSMTISTPTGEGVTNARTFVRLRRCVMAENLRIV